MRNDWLPTRLKELGKTKQGLAEALGVANPRVSEIIGGRRGVKAAEVAVMARYLDLPEPEIIARLTGRPPASAPAPTEAFAPRTATVPAAATLPLDVPVFGTAVGGQDADFEMNGEVIDRVRRPPGLANARNAFALYVVGTSMSPRYDEGDLIFVHPGRPPVAGCDVVVELKALDEFGRHKALLKTYRGKTPTRLLLSQLNPAGPLDVPLEDIRQVLRVLRTNELLGL